MATEIERKYLVKRIDLTTLPPGETIQQGYLYRDPITVRIRTRGAKAFLTIKCTPLIQRADLHAVVKDEYEYQIPVAEAKELLLRCGHCIAKTRHTLPNGIEIDVFHGSHAGLIIAEFESTDASPAPTLPGVEWIEVTGDRRYSNSWISRNGVPVIIKEGGMKDEG